MTALQARQRAIYAMVLGATLLSTSGVLIRLLEDASDWKIVFWRGVFLAVGIGSILCLQARGIPRPLLKRIGKIELIAGAFLCGALTCYVIAIAHTTVANAVFTMGAVPMFTALLAYIFIGERVTKTNKLAITICMLGIGIMVSDGISTGHKYGNLMALVAALCAAGFVVTLRHGNKRDMLPCLIVGALGSAFLAAYAENGNLLLAPHDLLICLILGGVVAALSQFLYVRASSHLLGAEVSLLATLEFILGPLWVLFIVKEIPSTLTALGGFLVLLAVGYPATITLISNRRQNP